MRTGCFIGLLLILSSISKAEDNPTASKAIFLKIFKVNKSARCMNCHTYTDAPLQGEKNQTRVHSMNIKTKIQKAGLGMRCQTCHANTQIDEPFMPPGAPKWRAPELDMRITEKTTPLELCTTWKSFPHEQPSLKKLLDHVKTDSLVIWSFNPGQNRVPAPGTHQELIDNVKAWIETGAHCPD